MSHQNKVTPNRSIINGVNAPLLEKTLNQNRRHQQSKNSIIWGSINIILLSIVLYDLAYTCPLYVSYLRYIEYAAAILLSLNVLYHFGYYLKLNIKNKPIAYTSVINPPLSTSAPGTPINKINSTPEHQSTPNISLSSTPMNTTALSWMSNSTPNESFNYPVKSDSWLYSRGSPKTESASPIKATRQDTSGIDFISDEDSLKTYLRDFETNEKITDINTIAESVNNTLTSFWSHPILKTTREASLVLKNCQYQFSPPITRMSIKHTSPPPNYTPLSIPNYYYGLISPFTNNLETVVSLVKSVTKVLALPPASSPTSPKGSPSQGMETWRRLCVDIVALTQWNANLRMWISQTILQRLIKEFDNLDDVLAKHNLGDIQIGKVGLDRLRKTAQTGMVLQFIPTLPTIIPFLEITSNQEYLINRIKELSKGGCMSEFKWNSGGSFNGKEWDSSLPTDSDVIMHLFASYLDTQLLPSPSQPDVKPFSGYHYVKLNNKLPTLTDGSLLIQQCSDYPPHYKIIIGEETYELVKGYNNLFHSILLFLYYVNKKQDGMLGRVNLGRSGVNMLWIIQS